MGSTVPRQMIIPNEANTIANKIVERLVEVISSLTSVKFEKMDPGDFPLYLCILDSYVSVQYFRYDRYCL